MHKVAVLHRDLALGAVGLMKSPLELLKPALSIIDLLLDHLALLLKGHLFILVVTQLLLGFLQFESNTIPLLFGLGLGLVQRVNLFAHLSNGAVVLLPQHGQSGLMSDVGLIQLHLQLGQLFLTSGVEGNLGSSVASCLLQFFVELIKLPAQGAASLVSPGTRLALRLKFLVELLKPSLQLLDLGVQLPTQGLLILDLAVEGAILLFLALQHLAHLDLAPLKVSDGLLSELQVAFHLPLELLDVALLLLLALP